MQDLTPREIQVVRALCDSPEPQGFIAEQLGISRDTIAKHLLHIFEKTGSESRIHLMHWAWKNGVAACPCGATGFDSHSH